VWVAVFIHRAFVVHSMITICYMRYIVDTMSLTPAISIQSMVQNIGDRAPAIPFSSAEERQCRQYAAAVTPCPGFIGNHCRLALGRHVDYRVSQCELVCPRALAHHTIGGGRTFTIDGRRTLGGARTVDSAFFAVHLSDINHQLTLWFEQRQLPKRRKPSGFLPIWRECQETRDRVLYFRTSRQSPINTKLIAVFSSL
jgi:hypothetical protein